MTAKKYFVITLILFAMIAMLFAIIVSTQSKDALADTTYTITWLDDAGNVIDVDELAEGLTPSHDAPEKASTSEFEYTFTGWAPEITTVTGPATYQATFSATTRSYTITWKNGDDTLETDTDVEYGTTPTYDGAIPTKASTAQYAYTFSGWTPAISSVTGDTTYTATFSETLRKYTIQWSINGVVVETDTNVEYGDMPSYDGETPTKESDAEFDYTFDGWSPVVAAVTGDVTYVATFVGQTRSYTITWKNGETILETDTDVEYGTTPTYDGATPTKESDAEFNYTFNGWSPAISEVQGNITYVATYEATTQTYFVHWLNGNIILETDVDVEYGTIPTYDGETPTKESTAQYSYTFTGWDPEVSAITGDTEYTAQFSETTRSYTITWKLDNGTTIETDSNVPYGATPEFNGALPTKMDDAQYTYGTPYWSPEVTPVTGDQTYTIVIPATVNTYTITWENEDGTVLETDEDVEYGETPTYDGETPTKASTAQYSYAFNGWSPAISEVQGNITYVATYEATTQTYFVHWLNGNIILETDVDVEYGTIPTYDGETPTKESTAQYSYTFTGWDPEVSAITGDTEYTAQFSETTRSYTITWNNFDNSTLKTDVDILYGEMPVYSGDTPTKPSDESYDYTFSGWSPEVSAVTGNVTYTAQFSNTYIQYKIEYPSEPGYVISVTKNGDSITSGDTVTNDDVVVVAYTILQGYADNGDFSIVGDDDTAYTRNEYTLTDIHTNITISLTVTANTYVIIFDQTGIDPMQQTTYQITYAQKVILPIPTKTGHTFVCWMHGLDAFTDETGLMLDYYDIAAGITLKASFVANGYKIIYDEYGKKESEDVTYGETYTLEIPIRPGYVFEGWYYNATQITDIEGDSITTYLYAKDIEAESKWTEITIVLNNDALRHTYRYGKPFEVVATVTPQNASTVTYSVSTEGVISLGQDGNYTIIGIGQTVLRATLDNGGAYKECPISVSDIFINDDYSSFNYLYITINGEEYGRKHAVICEDNTKMSTISKEILEYLNIPNAYVDRTDIGIELDPDAKFKDVFSEGDTLNINLIYSIEKATNTHVSYRLSAQTAEFGQKVYLEDLIAKEGYKLGDIIVTNEKGLEVEISQLERSFVMPSANVLVDVLLKNVVVESTNINNISIKSDIGIKSNAKFVLNKIDKNTYNQNITFSDRKQVVYAMHVDYIEGEQSLDYTDKYTIVMNVPEEFIGKDGMEVMYFQNGETIVKQIYIEGDTLTLTLAGAGDIVFVSNIHGSTVYLYWLIIIMLFVDALLGMIFVILFINYQDALQRRRELNGYSTVLPVLLLGAAIASEVAFLVFLGILFLVELIGIAWLALKLTNKYFIYTTYHKMTYVKPQDYNSVVKDIKDRQQNE